MPGSRRRPARRRGSRSGRDPRWRCSGRSSPACRLPPVHGIPCCAGTVARPRRACPHGAQTDSKRMETQPGWAAGRRWCLIPPWCSGRGGAGMDGDTEVGAAGGAWCWTFGEAEFDEGRWQLRVRGEPVDLERRPLEVLQYLLRHAGEAVTKDELLAAAWSGRVVVEAVLTNAIGKLR